MILSDTENETKTRDKSKRKNLLKTVMYKNRRGCETETTETRSNKMHILAYFVSSIDLSVPRLGGGFGGKAIRSLPVSCAAVVGSAVTGRSVIVSIC